MGLGNLFKGWVFFKVLSTGIVFIVCGLIFLVGLLSEREPIWIFYSLPPLLLGTGLTFVAYRIWKGEKEEDARGSPENTVSIGYSKEKKMKECPRCGKEKMDIALDGSGVCDNCGYATKEYYEEVD